MSKQRPVFPNFSCWILNDTDQCPLFFGFSNRCISHQGHAHDAGFWRDDAGFDVSTGWPCGQDARYYWPFRIEMSLNPGIAPWLTCALLHPAE